MVKVATDSAKNGWTVQRENGNPYLKNSFDFMGTHGPLKRTTLIARFSRLNWGFDKVSRCFLACH
jgi:hypothetical protein